MTRVIDQVVEITDSDDSVMATIDIVIVITSFPDVMNTILDRANQVKQQKKLPAALSGGIDSAKATAKDSEEVASSLGTVIPSLGAALQAIQNIMNNITDVTSFLTPFR